MTETDLQRFWSKVKVNRNGCWPWIGASGENHYGNFHTGGRINGRTRGAHRFIWEYCYGPIPEGLELHHTCGNKLCVNPSHLKTVTPAQHGKLHLSPYCKRGHKLTTENLYLIKGRKDRICRTCHLMRQRNYNKRMQGISKVV